jgi:WD40 repeat protein
MRDLDEFLNARGQQAELGAHITAAAFDHTRHVAAFALGDGTLRLTNGKTWTSIQAHAGAILALSPHPGGGFITGGDDGKFQNIHPNNTFETMAAYGNKWVEHTASFAGKTAYLAASVGKNLQLFTARGEFLRTLPHPSTVTGIAFDAKGKRVATSHYNGASLWFTASTADTPRKLEWKGSHTGIALHPAGAALVTAMQENALHGWTLPDAKHMRMSGYPAKTDSFGFTKSGRWLATSGADAIVLWPFFGGGPMGKAPLELAHTDGAIIKQIACHPNLELVAAGFDTGLTLAADITRERILPICGPGRGAITTLAWNQAGTHLAIGTETGFAALVDFSAG